MTRSMFTAHFAMWHDTDLSLVYIEIHTGMPIPIDRECGDAGAHVAVRGTRIQPNHVPIRLS